MFLENSFLCQRSENTIIPIFEIYKRSENHVLEEHFLCQRSKNNVLGDPWRTFNCQRSNNALLVIHEKSSTILGVQLTQRPKNIIFDANIIYAQSFLILDVQNGT